MIRLFQETPSSYQFKDDEGKECGWMMCMDDACGVPVWSVTLCRPGEEIPIETFIFTGTPPQVEQEINRRAA